MTTYLTAMAIAVAVRRALGDAGVTDFVAVEFGRPGAEFETTREVLQGLLARIRRLNPLRRPLQRRSRRNAPAVGCHALTRWMAQPFTKVVASIGCRGWMPVIPA